MDFDFKTAWDLEGLTPNTFFPIPASVVFATWVGSDSGAKGHPLKGSVERWLGVAGSPKVTRSLMPITDTSVVGDSPYSKSSRNGATIFPSCLFFVEEAENTAIVQAGQTITVKPRRSAQEKRPWRDLDLAAITGQAVETEHVFPVHLGETLAPYILFDPLKAVLPLSQSEMRLPSDDAGVGGIDLGALERRTPVRWRTVSELWEQNKTGDSRLDLLGQVDYMRKLSSQLEWRQDAGNRPVQVAYNQSGAPTAAMVPGNETLVDYTLYRISCKSEAEARYLVAIINSGELFESVAGLMPKGQYGARHLQKHLWKLPIPEFDDSNPLHVRISEVGSIAGEGAAAKLEQLREERDRVTVTIARREIRKWLASSEEGRAVEEAVSELLGT